MTNARFASLRFYANRALVTSGIRIGRKERRASVCGSTAALRSDCVPFVSPSPLHCFRSPTADRSQIADGNNFFYLRYLTAIIFAINSRFSLDFEF